MEFLYCMGVYSFCDGLSLLSGLYLGIVIMCLVLFLVFVLLKVVYVFSCGYLGVVEVVLFLCLFVLVIGYVVVVYSISCSESSKFFVYKIDIEVVSFY